jgi:hypothetical protein
LENNYPSHSEQAKREKVEKTHKKGTSIVIFGALASVLLWFIILATGDSIEPFSNSNSSTVYAIVVSMPPIVLSILGMIKVGRRKSY